MVNVIESWSEVKFVLVVEKDTLFHYPADNKFHKKHSCILVTGKGEVDVYTRMLVRKLKDGF